MPFITYTEPEDFSAVGSPLVAEYFLLKVQKVLDYLKCNLVKKEQRKIFYSYSRQITKRLKESPDISEMDTVPDNIAFLFEKIIDVFEVKFDWLYDQSDSIFKRLLQWDPKHGINRYK